MFAQTKQNLRISSQTEASPITFAMVKIQEKHERSAARRGPIMAKTLKEYMSNKFCQVVRACTPKQRCTHTLKRKI
jgi:hypothetical protein